MKVRRASNAAEGVAAVHCHVHIQGPNGHGIEHRIGLEQEVGRVFIGNVEIMLLDIGQSRNDTPRYFCIIRRGAWVREDAVAWLGQHLL